MEPIFFTSSDSTEISETTGMSEVTGTSGMTGISGATGMSEMTGGSQVTGMSEVTKMSGMTETSEMDERMSSSPELPVLSTVVIITDRKTSGTTAATDSTFASGQSSNRSSSESSITPKLCYVIRCPWNDSIHDPPSTYSPCRGTIRNQSIKKPEKRVGSFIKPPLN